MENRAVHHVPVAHLFRVTRTSPTVYGHRQTVSLPIAAGFHQVVSLLAAIRKVCFVFFQSHWFGFYY